MKPETQQEVKKLQEEIEWIKGSLQGTTPLRSIFETKSPKRDIIQKWAEDLERLALLGVFKKPISYISTHISHELLEMGLNEAIPYVRENLSFKYKDVSHMRLGDEDTPRGETAQNSSKPKRQNKSVIIRLRQTAKLLEKFSKELESKPFNPEIPEEELEEFMVRWDRANDHLKEVMNRKEKVFPSKQFIYFYYAATTSATYAYAKYLLHIRKDAAEKFTPKQAGKLVLGNITNLDPLYEPKNREEAKLIGRYYGFPCPECGSFRVIIKWNTDKKDNLCYCFKCKAWSTPQTEKLPVN